MISTLCTTISLVKAKFCHPDNISYDHVLQNLASQKRGWPVQSYHCRGYSVLQGPHTLFNSQMAMGNDLGIALLVHMLLLRSPSLSLTHGLVCSSAMIESKVERRAKKKEKRKKWLGSIQVPDFPCISFYSPPRSNCTRNDSRTYPRMNLVLLFVWTYQTLTASCRRVVITRLHQVMVGEIAQLWLLSCNLMQMRALWILIFFEMHLIIYIGNSWSILWEEMERNMGRHTCRKETRPRLVSLPKEHQKNREK